MRYTNETPDAERELTPTIRFSSAELVTIGGFPDVAQCTDDECHRFICRAIEAALLDQQVWLAKSKVLTP